MKKGDVVLGGLVPTNQDAPETVQPTMSAFHHPAPGFESSLPFDGLSLLASAADVGGEAELVQGAAHLGEIVAFVQAHPLGLLWAGRRTVCQHVVHRGPHQLDVVAVGPVHCQTYRNALGFGQQATLDAPLAPVGGVGAGFSPRPGATWSWPRPYSPNSSPAPSVRRSVPVPPATTPGTPQRQPTPGKAQVGGGAGTDARGVQRFPLATGAQGHWRRCGREPGEAMGVHMLWDQGLQHPRWSLWKLPVVALVLVAGPARLGRGGLGLSLWSLPKSRRNPSLASRNGASRSWSPGSWDSLKCLRVQATDNASAPYGISQISEVEITESALVRL